MRTKGGLMGYPNPAESPYDLMMTGHAGCSVATALGLKCCATTCCVPRTGRHCVAVDRRRGLPLAASIYEAMNNTGGLKKKLIVVLNDNQACRSVRRVGGHGRLPGPAPHDPLLLPGLKSSRCSGRC